MNKVQVTHESGNGRPEARVETRAGRFVRPNVDIVETPEALFVYADMPGTSPDNISLQFENGTLTLTGQVQEHTTSDAGPLLREFSPADFKRKFEISEDIDSEKITADYRNGLLTLMLPKAEQRRPRKITVQGE